ncbi:MAG: T9SS type A sorting domain-containing protein [Bacteroidota bacterium]
MKKSLLALGLLTFLSYGVYAQSILNGSFEDWTTTQYDDLSNWANSNRETLRSGIISVTKVSGVTGSAVKLETSLSSMGDTMGAFISNTPGDPLNGEGGVPFSQIPTAFTGKYKANMAGSDSAILLINFKKNGASIGTMFFTLGGKNQTTFSTFSFPISLTTAPDSVIIACASSNLLTQIGVAIGSNITYDDFAFTGPGVTQTIPNGNFETWTVMSSDKINGWDVGGPMECVSKVPDAYKGTAALKLVTISGENGSVNEAYLINGKFPQQRGSIMGLPFTNQNDTLIGYYKFSTPGVDSASISVQTTKGGNFVGGSYLALEPKATYTQFRIPVISTDVPDSIIIIIGASSIQGSDPTLGNILILDEVQLASAPLNTGLLTLSAKADNFNLYPNPASNTLFISNIETGATISIYDITGKLMLTQTKTDADNKTSINIDQLHSGIYQCIIVDKTGASSQQKFLKH